MKNCHQAIGFIVGIWHTLPAWMQVVWSSLNSLESSSVRAEDGGGVRDYDSVVHIPTLPQKSREVGGSQEQKQRVCHIRNRDKVELEYTRWLMDPLQFMYRDHVTQRHGLLPHWLRSYSKEKKAAQMLSGSLDSSSSFSDTTLLPGRPPLQGSAQEKLSLTCCARLGG